MNNQSLLERTKLSNLSANKKTESPVFTFEIPIRPPDICAGCEGKLSPHPPNSLIGKSICIECARLYGRISAALDDVADEKTKANRLKRFAGSL